ncbi:MAG TPA: nucleotidyltransferase family protein [Bryobacteraceae bacterium]
MRTHFLAVLEALRFRDGSADDLHKIPENVWPAVLKATDSAHLTPALGVRCRDSLPESVRRRIENNLATNAVRYERLVAAHIEIDTALASRDIEYVVLKGLAQWPYYIDDPRLRPQYDIDIYVPDESRSAAAKAMRELGYTPVNNTPDPGADHLPVMIRRTGWTWRGDYFDPDMPASLELHFRFWNRETMRFDVGDLTPFWQRRLVRNVAGLELPMLDPVDGLSYSALHLLRHLLGGDLRLRHVYEIAHFLERSADDDAFWSRWRESALPLCRIAEGIAFRLAADWFHCNQHPHAQGAIEQLPEPVQRWFKLFSSSPELAFSKPDLASGKPDLAFGEHDLAFGKSDKSELWLHFCLLNRAKDRCAIASRRLFPMRRARVVVDAHVPEMTAALRMKRIAGEASFLAARALHHLRTLAPAIRGAYRWWSWTESFPIQTDEKPVKNVAPVL